MMFAYRYTPVFLGGGALGGSGRTQSDTLFQPRLSLWDRGTDWFRLSPFSRPGSYRSWLLTGSYRPQYLSGLGGFTALSTASDKSVLGSGSTNSSGGQSAGGGAGGGSAGQGGNASTGQGGAGGAQKSIVFDRINLSDADKAYLFRRIFEDVIQNDYSPELQWKFLAAAYGAYQLTDQDIRDYYTQRRALQQRRLSEQATQQQQSAQKQDPNARWERLWETLLIMTLFRGMMGG